VQEYEKTMNNHLDSVVSFIMTVMLNILILIILFWLPHKF